MRTAMGTRRTRTWSFVGAIFLLACGTSGVEPQGSDAAPEGDSSRDGGPDDDGSTSEPDATDGSGDTERDAAEETDGDAGKDEGNEAAIVEAGDDDAAAAPHGEVACSDIMCDVAAGRYCCATEPDGSATVAGYECKMEGSSCGGVSITCAGKKNCAPGYGCCAHKGLPPPLIYQSTTCEESCDGRWFCHAAEDCPPHTDPLDPVWKCSPSSALAGFGYCSL